jgi:hypothetical protein
LGKVVKNRSFEGSERYKMAFVSVIYLSVLLCILLFVRDYPNHMESNTTVHRLLKISPFNDAATFAKAAIEVVENGWLLPGSDWIFNLWPPGFVLLEALMLKILGMDCQLILALQVVAAVLLTSMLILNYVFLKKRIPLLLAICLPLLIFVFPVTRIFMLEPDGVSLGETYSIGFFLIFVLLALSSIEEKSLWAAVGAGVSLALAAYFRSQFEILLTMLTLCGVFLIVFRFLISKKQKQKTRFGFFEKSVLCALFFANLTTLPWRMYHFKNHNSFKWVHTQSLTFQNALKSNEHYSKVLGGGLITEGRGNLVCIIDPTTCGQTTDAGKIFFKTFLLNPIKWYTLKGEVIGKYWFSAADEWGAPGLVSTFLENLANSVLLLLALASVLMLFLKRLRSQACWPTLLWIHGGFLSAFLLIFTFAHFEVRYFFFPKIFFVFMAVLEFSLFFGRKKTA